MKFPSNEHLYRSNYFRSNDHFGQTFIGKITQLQFLSIQGTHLKDRGRAILFIGLGHGYLCFTEFFSMLSRQRKIIYTF
jgi:hypothetical protein